MSIYVITVAPAPALAGCAEISLGPGDEQNRIVSVDRSITLDSAALRRFIQRVQHVHDEIAAK